MMHISIRHPRSPVASWVILIALGWLPNALWAQVGQLNTDKKPDVLKHPAFLIDATSNEIAPDDSSNFGSIVSDPINVALTHGRTSLAIQESLKPLAAKLAPSIAIIVGADTQQTLGTIVSADGLIVAKHSELPSSFRCKLNSGESYPGKLIGIHPQNDLALIQIKATDLKPIVFNNQTLQPVNPGHFVVSIDVNRNTIGLGMVSVVPQTFNGVQSEFSDCVDFGATVNPTPVGVRLPTENGETISIGLEVSRVYPRTPAESIGLLVGDQLQSINGTPLTNDIQLNEIAKTLKVGQRLTLGIIREQRPQILSTQIQRISQRTIPDRWGGGPFSGRRFGFGQVIAHDSVIEPESCGGPLADLNGNVVGINIARSLRAATFAIPLSDVLLFIKYVRPKVQLLNE